MPPFTKGTDMFEPITVVFPAVVYYVLLILFVLHLYLSRKLFKARQKLDASTQALINNQMQMNILVAALAHDVHDLKGKLHEIV